MATDSEPAPQSLQLTPLTSIRFFAALHIFIFHIYEAHRIAAGESGGFTLPIFDALPAVVLNTIRHGYFSTSLFFLLSGFILTFLYVLPSGRMSIDQRTFWVARAARVYPLHILLMIILGLPVLVVQLFAGGFIDTAIRWVLCTTLLQAWFPPYALSLNFPTWALSAVAFYYLMFPLLVQLLRMLNRLAAIVLLCCLPAVSLIPSIIFLYFHPDGGKDGSFWHEFVMRTPLFWIPHFLMGMLLSRVCAINRFDVGWQTLASRWISWGDVACAAVLIVAMLELGVPRFLLRHGLLAPLYLVMVLDLAHNRGLLARLLCLPGMQTLGDTSFSIFMLQVPAMIIVWIPAYFLQPPSALIVAFMVAVAVGLSLVSTRYFEKPLSRWLRARSAARWAA